MSRLNGIGILSWCVALTVGCASAPSHFYTLTPTPMASPGSGPPGLSIVVGPVTVPEVVDRPQIVLRVGTNQVTLDEFNRWASSLQDEIARTVAQNLMARFGTPNVALASQRPTPEPGFRVTIVVQRFESALGDAATLDAQWTVRRAREEAIRTGRTTVSESARGGAHDALASAHSRAIGRLSEDIAEAIASLAAQ
jgi:uncharacterized lipoprotein YmbA